MLPACAISPQPREAVVDKKKCEDLKEEEFKKSIPSSFNKRKKLDINEQASFYIYARRRINFSGINIKKGATYSFDVSTIDNWCDNSVKAEIDGWPDQKTLKRLIVSWSRIISRFSTGRLFTIIGGIHNKWNSRFDMGKKIKNGEMYFADLHDENGELYAFANDIYFMYYNNFGRVKITLTKVSDPAE